MALWQAQPTHLGRKLLHHFLLGVDVRSIWPCSLSLEFIGLNQAAAPFVMKPASRFPSVHRKQKTEGWETQRVGKFQFSVRLVLSPTIERTPSLHPIHHATHWHVCHHCGGSQTFIRGTMTSPAHPPWSQAPSPFSAWCWCQIYLTLFIVSWIHRVEPSCSSICDEASQSFPLHDFVAGFQHF